MNFKKFVCHCDHVPINIITIVAIVAAAANDDDCGDDDIDKINVQDILFLFIW